MSTALPPGGRLRAYLEFIAAVVFFLPGRDILWRIVAQQLCPTEGFAPLVEQGLLAAFLIFGFASFGYLFRQAEESGECAGSAVPLWLERGKRDWAQPSDGVRQWLA